MLAYNMRRAVNILGVKALMMYLTGEADKQIQVVDRRRHMG